MKNTINIKLIVLCLVLCLPLTGLSQRNKTNKLHVVSFNKYKEYTDVNTGFWKAYPDEELICIELTDRQKQKQRTYFIVNCFEENEMEVNASGFSINRRPGSLVFNGGLKNGKGEGGYVFKREADFESFLQKEGYDISDELYYFKLFLGDISKDYILGIKALGYTPTIRELGRTVYHDAGLEYIRALTKLYKKDITLDMISKLAIHDVSLDYIKALKSLDFIEADPEMVKKLAIHKVSIPYIKALSQFDFEDLSASEIKKAKIHGVTLEYIIKARQKGYAFNELHDYIKLKIHNKLN